MIGALANLGMGLFNMTQKTNQAQNTMQQYPHQQGGGNFNMQGQGMPYLGLHDSTVQKEKVGSGLNQAIGTASPLLGALGEGVSSLFGKKERVVDPFVRQMQQQQHQAANMGVQAGNNMASSTQGAALAASRDVADRATRSGLSSGAGVDNALVGAASSMAKDTQMAGNYSRAAAQGGQAASAAVDRQSQTTGTAADRTMYDWREELPGQLAGVLGSVGSTMADAQFQGAAHRNNMNMAPLNEYTVTSEMNRDLLGSMQGEKMRQMQNGYQQGLNPMQMFMQGRNQKYWR